MSTDVKKVLLLIYPRFKPYYSDYEIFNDLEGFDTYILVDRINIFNRSTVNLKGFLKGKYVTILGLGKTGVSDISFLLNLREVFTKLSPSFVVTMEPYSSITFQISVLKEKYAFKHVVWCYDTATIDRSLWGAFPLTNHFFKKSLASIDLFIANSRRTRDSLVNSGVNETKVRVIYPSIPMSGSTERLSKCHNANFTILYIGGLLKNKGICTLMKSFSDPRVQENGNIYLNIAGKGPLIKEVEQFARTNRRVKYYGYIDEGEKSKLFLQSDLFVYPSEDSVLLGKIRWEEQGALSVREAVCNGLPVLVSNSGVLPELVGTSQFVFTQGCAECLTVKILQLYEKREDLIADVNRLQKKISEESSILINKLRIVKLLCSIL